VTHNQRVLNLLSDGKPHTHHEIYALNVIAHSRIADLRRQGYTIPSWTYTENGKRVYLYQLLAKPKPEWTCPFCGSKGYRHVTDGIFRCSDCNYDITETLPGEGGKRVQADRNPQSPSPESVPAEEGGASSPQPHPHPL
jgi:hypothetical protein